jgi:hypothetical protein
MAMPNHPSGMPVPQMDVEGITAFDHCPASKTPPKISQQTAINKCNMNGSSLGCGSSAETGFDSGYLLVFILFPGGLLGNLAQRCLWHRMPAGPADTESRTGDTPCQVIVAFRLPI